MINKPINYHLQLCPWFFISILHNDIPFQLWTNNIHNQCLLLETSYIRR